MDQLGGYKTNHNLKKIETIEHIFYSKDIKLEASNQKINEKHMDILKINNTILNNPWIKKKLKENLKRISIM